MLESHPPTAIIIHAEFLPHILELIYDAHEHGSHHTVIVVGEPSAQVMATVASQVRVLKWSDIERDGTRIEKNIIIPPSQFLIMSSSR